MRRRSRAREPKWQTSDLPLWLSMLGVGSRQVWFPALFAIRHRSHHWTGRSGRCNLSTNSRNYWPSGWPRSTLWRGLVIFFMVPDSEKGPDTIAWRRIVRDEKLRRVISASAIAGSKLCTRAHNRECLREPPRRRGTAAEHKGWHAEPPHICCNTWIIREKYRPQGLSLEVRAKPATRDT